jgi:hypothetical protein
LNQLQKVVDIVFYSLSYPRPDLPSSGFFIHPIVIEFTCKISVIGNLDRFQKVTLKVEIWDSSLLRMGFLRSGFQYQSPLSEEQQKMRDKLEKDLLPLLARAQSEYLTSSKYLKLAFFRYDEYPDDGNLIFLDFNNEWSEIGRIVIYTPVN